jgi:hypothetical protein
MLNLALGFRKQRSRLIFNIIVPVLFFWTVPSLLYFSRASPVVSKVEQPTNKMIRNEKVKLSLRVDKLVRTDRQSRILYITLVCKNLFFSNSHIVGLSPNWVHSIRRPLLTYCTCPGWLWEWRSL